LNRSIGSLVISANRQNVSDKRLAASSISVAVAALRFLYAVTLRREWTIEDDIPTCRQPRQLPEVLCPKFRTVAYDSTPSDSDARPVFVKVSCSSTSSRVQLFGYRREIMPGKVADGAL
jgi:hypothetical protein